MTVKNDITGIQQAVDAAGGQVKLAKSIGVTQQYISFAVRQGYISPDRAIEIESQFGIPRLKLVNPKLVRTLDLQSCA